MFFFLYMGGKLSSLVFQSALARSELSILAISPALENEFFSKNRIDRNDFGLHQ